MSRAPKISVITPTLNAGRWLRETIESVQQQSLRDFEHIVVDGGSTDDTLNILTEYPHIRWISEKENPGAAIAEAYRRAFLMSRGQYIIQCCASDGFVNRDWFKECARVLDADAEVSLVWGLPQYMTEDGKLGKISYVEFLEQPPPQKTEFFPFWLATGFLFPEGNYCVRRKVFDHCSPRADSSDEFRHHWALGFIYNFNTLGYLPYFLPTIANIGRIHQGRRERVLAIEKSLEKRYFKFIKACRKRFLKGEAKHCFRNGAGEVLKEVTSRELGEYKVKIWKYRIATSPFVRTDLYTLYSKLRQKGVRNFLALIWERLSRA